MQMNLSKIWFNEFLRNAAFPAVVLAFACAPINNEIAEVRIGRFIDHVRAQHTSFARDKRVRKKQRTDECLWRG
jgi:hypothetical protein